MSGRFANFSELYRAAYAEPDPARKAVLLGEVRKALNEWEQMLENWVATPLPPVAAVESHLQAIVEQRICSAA